MWMWGAIPRKRGAGLGGGAGGGLAALLSSTQMQHGSTELWGPSVCSLIIPETDQGRTIPFLSEEKDCLAFSVLNIPSCFGNWAQGCLSFLHFSVPSFKR